MRLWVVAVMVCGISLPVVLTKRILFLAPISVKSQKNFYMSIVNALADHGHQVTMVSPFKPLKIHENVQEIVLPEMDLVKVLPNLFSGNKVNGPLTLMQVTPKLCSDALAEKKIQDLKAEKFDLIMLITFFSDCFLSLVHQMNVPFISVSTIEMSPFTDAVGNPNFPSFAAHRIFNFQHPLSFIERMKNTIIHIFISAGYRYFVVHRMESECRHRSLCPADMPSFSDLRFNTSLMLVNSVKTVEFPARPIVPAMVHVGAINCQPPQPLPKDLEEWVKEAGSDGYIFFSLGSAVTPSSMPKEYRKTLLEVFGSMKQRVLWKWDQDTMEDLPTNVRLGKWLPQQDILGDPRLRLFITHGGLLSTLESMYHGTPVLGMPVFIDQESNMREVERNGWGHVLLWKDLTPDTLRQSIQFVMSNKELRVEAARRSVLVQDQPQDPRDVAVYWVEYVMRHHGAPHLRSPITSMSWVEVYNIDVWTVVVGVVVVLIWVGFLLLRALCHCFCSPRGKRKLE